MMANKATAVRGLTGGIEGLFKKYKVNLFIYQFLSLFIYSLIYLLLGYLCQRFW